MIEFLFLSSYPFKANIANTKVRIGDYDFNV